MMSLTEKLPSDLLLRIISFLSAEDMPAVSLTNKLMHKLANDELLWKAFCFRDFTCLHGHERISLPLNYTGFAAVYKNLLHKYAGLCDLWVRDLAVYGGIVDVLEQVLLSSRLCSHFTHEYQTVGTSTITNELKAYECLPPVHNVFHCSEDSASWIDGQFRFRRIPLFTCELQSDDTRASVVCFQEADEVGAGGHFAALWNGVGCPNSIPFGAEGYSTQLNCHCCSSFRQVRCSDVCLSSNISVDLNGREFSFRCHDFNKHETLEHESYWLRREFGFVLPPGALLPPDAAQLMNHEIFASKFRRWKQASAHYICRRMSNERLNNWQVASPLEPGLFVALYGGHGWEVLKLESFMKAGRPFLRGLKVTGDANVPAGVTSFEIDCSAPLMSLDSEIESDVDLLCESIKQKMEPLYQPLQGRFDTVACDNENVNNAAEIAIDAWWNRSDEGTTDPKRFKLPDGVDIQNEGNGFELSKFYAFRLCGFGQIALEDFDEPSLTPVLYFHLNANQFAILWLELSSLDVFYRAHT